MAQYATDFSGYTTGVIPSDWTLRFGTGTWTVESVVGSVGGKALTRSGDSDFDFLSWDAIDADADRDDVEVLFKVRFPVTTGTEMRALLRGSDTSGRTGYVMGSRPDTGNLNASRLNGGTFTDFEVTVKGITADVWYWVRARINGTTAQLNMWADGDSEPALAVNEAEASISGVGWVGLYSNRDATVQIDFFGVGTNGDVAPSEITSRIVTADAETYAPGATATVALTTFDGAPTLIELEYGAYTVDVTALCSSITSSGFTLAVAGLAEYASGESHARIRWDQDITLRVTEAGGDATTTFQIVAPDTDGPTYWAGTVGTPDGDTALPAGSASGDDSFFEVKTGTNVVVNTTTGSSGADSASWSVEGRYFDVSGESWSGVNLKELTSASSSLTIPIAMAYYRNMLR